jgi:hypothetical protein
MSNPSKALAVLKARRKPIALAAATLCLLPLMASLVQAGITTEERKNGFDAATTAAASQPKGTLYQVRCWQEGRLVLEENDVQFPNDLTAQGLKLRGQDKQRRPIYLADTKNATCIVRGMPSEKAPFR